MPHFFASKLCAVALPARTKNFEFIFEAKSVRDESAIIFAKSLAKFLHGEQKILLSKQKKGERLLVKFNKHFAPHSKEIIKSALKEYAELAGAEIASHNLNENKIKVDSAYLLEWQGICALLGGNSSLGLHSADFANLGRLAQTSSLALRPKFAKNHESQTENSSVVDSVQSAESREKYAKIAESTLDSAESQNLAKKELCEAPENSPASWCKKSESKGAEVPPADFLLEAEKRGSPSKSEKRQLLGTQFKKVGESGAGGAALLRKESREIDENSGKVAESSVDSADSTLSTQEANSSIFDEKSGLCSCERENRTNGSLTRAGNNLPDLSQKDAEFACLEIGFGSGRHILHLAQKHPNARIIGLEIYRPAISQVLRQIEILELQNLYLASLDARVLCEVLPAKCLDRIYLHFPVPWLKNPQRRVLSAQFLGNAMRALKDDGFFELLTDSAEYFAFAKALARDYKFVAEEGAKGEVVSKYEARWRRQEKVIYKLCIYPALNSSLGTPCGDLADFGHCADSSLALRPKSAKNSTTSTANTRICDLDSANQTQNTESTLDSAESQNLNQNNPRVSANLESRPLRGAKNRIQASRSASADFLLEAEKRGSPPKSEKRQLLARRGSGVGGAALLREKSSENNSNENAESSLDSAVNCHESANADSRNDENRDSSPMAQNDKIMDCNADSANLLAMTDFNGLPRSRSLARNDDSFLDSAISQNLGENGGNFAESALDSANRTPFSPTKICKKEYFLHIKNKYIFEGGVVLFASFGAYYAPSSAYFVICGDCVYTISEIIPTSANIDAVELFMELCFDN